MTYDVHIFFFFFMQVILQQVEILREIFIINRNSNVDSEVKLMDELYGK